MKWLSPGLAVLLIVTGLLWFREHDKAVAQRALAQATADSITVVIAHYDSSNAAEDSARAVLLDVVDSLTYESQQITASLSAAKFKSDSLLYTLSIQMYADSTLTDSTRAAITNVVSALQDEILECTDLVDNCEERVGLLSSQLARDTVLMIEWRTEARNLAELYRAEILKRQPKRFSIGVILGYGATLAKGTVYAGPSITVGLSIRLFSF